MQTTDNSKNKLTADEIIDQGSRPDADAIQRQMLRGDETKGDADERDIAGALYFEETPRGGEERKTQIKKETHNND